MPPATTHAAARDRYARGCPAAALAALETLLAAAQATPGADITVLANDAGVVAEQLGRYGLARQHYETALAALARRDAPVDAALLGANLAALYYRLSRYPEARDRYRRVVAELEKHPAEVANLSAALSGLGLVEQTLDQLDAARAPLERALALDLKRVGERHADVATDLSNLGDLERRLGHFDAAVPLYERALAVRRQVLPAGHPDLATSLSKLGVVHENLGQYLTALDFHAQALALREATFGPQHPAVAVSLQSRADVLLRLQRYDQARPLYERVLAIRAQALPAQHADTASALHHYGWLQQQAGDAAAAVPLLERALAMRVAVLGRRHALVADSRARLGTARFELGEVPQALALLGAAQAEALVAGVPDVVFRVGMQLATVQHASGAPELAIFTAKQALNALQGVRARSRGLRLELQRSLLDANGRAYRDLAQWLVEAGRLTEAEEVLAMLKEFEVVDLTQRTDQVRTEAALVGREAAAARDAEALLAAHVREAAELAQLDRRRAAGDTLSEAEEQRFDALQDRAEAWRDAWQAWLAGLPARLGRPATAGGSAGAGAAVASAQAAVAALAPGRLQTLLRADPQAVGLQYVVGADRIAIVLTTAQGAFGRFAGVKRSVLNTEVARLRQALLDRTDVLPAAQALYRLLIGPVAADLATLRPSTLVLSLTDILRYVPFAALHDGRQYLIEQVALVNFNAAVPVAAPAAAAARPAWRVAAFGVTQGGANFSPLPAVRDEVRAIVREDGVGSVEGRTAGAVTPVGGMPALPVAGAASSPASAAGGILPGRVALDEAVDLRSLREVLRGSGSPFNVLHLASHFSFQAGDEKKSVLLLGKGETISISRLASLNFAGYEQVTLSACQTASGGGINENGAEVEGLAAVVQAGGAAAVLASLWPVADASTAALMAHFYAGRSVNPVLQRAAALRAAQLALLQGATTIPSAVEATAAAADATRAGRRADLPAGAARPVTVTDPQRPWAHPYFWAPFVLSGSWS